MAHGFAGSTKAMLHAFISLTQLLGDLTDLHTVINMQTVDLATILWQTSQSTLHLLHHLTD